MTTTVEGPAPRAESGNDRRPSRRAVLAGLAAGLASGRPAGAATSLRLAHGLPSTHPVHRSMLNFAEIVRHRTRDEVAIAVFSDGVLGEEPALIEQVRAGGLDLTKASASVLDAVNPLCEVFNLPFLLQSKDHWRRVVTGPVGRRILAVDEGPVFALTFYDAGARSFYGQRPIVKPEDLKGLKIRVQPSPSTMRMVELLDAEPWPMPWGSVYTALQTGLIDGAENNLTALTFGRHAEVVKYYSLTEHTMVPDVLLMNRASFAALAPEHQGILRSAAAESALLQSFLWEQAEVESLEASERLGVTFQAPDKPAFAKRLLPLRAEFARQAELAELIRDIDKA